MTVDKNGRRKWFVSDSEFLHSVENEMVGFCEELSRNKIAVDVQKVEDSFDDYASQLHETSLAIT